MSNTKIESTKYKYSAKTLAILDLALNNERRLESIYNKSIIFFEDFLSFLVKLYYKNISDLEREIVL